MMKNRSEFKIPIEAVNFVSKSEYVYKSLREAILQGVLKPGDELNQVDLAERFNMSRMPIRDAIKLLAREGLVRIVLHKGATVVNFSGKDIREIYAIRKILEGFALAEAIPNINEDTISKLEKINKSIERHNRKGDVDAMIKENERFHQLLYKPCQNKKLIKLIENIWSSYPKRLFWEVPGRADRAVIDHMKILAAVRDRDTARAQKLIRDHLFVDREVLERIENVRSA